MTRRPVEELDAIIADGLTGRRLPVLLMTGFGVLALVLASVGRPVSARSTTEGARPSDSSRTVGSSTPASAAASASSHVWCRSRNPSATTTARAWTRLSTSTTSWPV